MPTSLGPSSCSTATSRPTSSSPSRSTSSRPPTIDASTSCSRPGRPAAVIGATGRGGGMGGGLYPYPLIEDGDFELPNAYTTEDDRRPSWSSLAGEVAALEIVSERLTLEARQLTAARGPVGAPRAIVVAHIDSKGGSPGAIDNATGVAALLGTAELLGRLRRSLPRGAHPHERRGLLRQLRRTPLRGRQRGALGGAAGHRQPRCHRRQGRQHGGLDVRGQ